MEELVWLNGQTLPLSQAKISIEDRGFQFADGVYEVVRLYNGKPFTLREHLQRLVRSAQGIELTPPMDEAALTAQIHGLLERVKPADGMIYLQLTRGCAPRNHLYPACAPTLLFYVRALPPLPPIEQVTPVKLHSVADERWKRCWIKSIALLPNVLAKNTAQKAGADEAAFVDTDVVSECSAGNLFIISGDTLITHPAGPKVLPGITRMVVMELVAGVGLRMSERPPTLAEAKAADEIFVTSTTREISPVSHWDGVAVGRSVKKTRRLHAAYRARVTAESGAGL